MIENDGKVVATNAVEPTMSGVFDLPATDAVIVDGIKERCLVGRVRLVNANGEWYLGTFGKARDFYVYTYAPAQRYFEVVAAVVASVLALYGGVIALLCWCAAAPRANALPTCCCRSATMATSWQKRRAKLRLPTLQRRSFCVV
mgnify:CR=1 FL=1